MKKDKKTCIVKEFTKKDFNKFLDSFNKEPGEYTDDELFEIGSKYKELPTSEKRWDELVKILGSDKTGECFRIWIKGRQYANGTIAKNEHMLSGQTIDDLTYPEFESKVEEQKRELYKQQTKTRDVYNGYRRVIRDVSRVESFKDEIITAIKCTPKLPKITFSDSNKNRKSEAVLCLSDWHWGTEVSNFKQTVNSDVLRSRLSKVVADSIKFCKQFGIHTLHVLGLADLIAGHIHQTIRIEQQMDIAQQIIESSEALAEVLNALQKAAPTVYFHQITGNHDRMTPNKNESIERESFCKITEWYLKEKLKDSDIIFADNKLDDSLGMFTLQDGRVCCYEHGHLASKQSSFQNMCGATHNYVSFIFLAHYHSSSARDYQGCRVFVNSSLVGTEDYAMSKRLFGDPAQKLVIFEDNGNIVDIDIKFNR